MLRQCIAISHHDKKAFKCGNFMISRHSFFYIIERPKYYSKVSVLNIIFRLEYFSEINDDEVLRILYPNYSGVKISRSR